MPIINNDRLETLELPGLKHQSIGGHKQGADYGSPVADNGAWRRGPGALPRCEVILVLSSSSTCAIGDDVFSCGLNSTLILKPGVVHQIVNTSHKEMRLVAAFGVAPDRVKTANGAALPVPWEAPSE